MKTDTDELIDRFLILVCWGFLMGGILGCIIGLVDVGRRTTKETINLCVEKPKECKVKYDFYQLENQK
jgi:F0F1-type ATP synthase assembly protein I